MAKMIDISAKLTNEKPVLKLAADKIYEIDDRKNTILKLNQKMQDTDLNNIDALDDMFKIVLGEKAAQEINDMDLSLSAYQTVMIAVMAAISGEEYEVAEARFLKEKSKL